MRRLLSFGTAVVLLFACARQMDELVPTTVPEGEPAAISLQISLPGMAEVSRVAGLDPNASKTVRGVWVGVYNARTGERTGTVSASSERITNDHNWLSLKLDAKSGASYIVAVGNAADYNGFDIERGTPATNLLTLLQAADTWEKYKRIASIMSDPQAIQRTSDNFLMSGIYLDEGKNNHGRNASYSSWLNGSTHEPVPVNINPGQNVTLPGRVHLRRLVSYVKFNIRPVDHLTFTPISWQIHNLPGVAFVHERHDEDPKLVNAADARVVTLPGRFGGRAYHESLLYENSTFIGERDGSNNLTGAYSFDFYQLENKHQGLPLTSGFSADEVKTPYHYRELEYKTEGTGVGDIRTQGNTGWYRSLVSQEAYNRAESPAVPSSDADLRNNNATYVEITGRIEYYYRTDAAGRVDGAENGELTYAPIAYPGPDFNVGGIVYDENNLPDYVVRRVAQATYTIHLGYCEGGTDEAKARDFNCRRNTQYTYNVTIAGVDKIRVEAVADNNSPDERYPGVEGTVTDVIGQPINLDSHYGVFNIKMSDQDRMNMIWRIKAPFGDEIIDMVYDSKGFLTSENSSVINLHEEKEMYDNLPQNQFYNWIQIRPTTGEDLLAHYPGDPRLKSRTKIRNDDIQTTNKYYDVRGIPEYAQKANDPGVWYLDQLNRPADFPHPGAPISENYRNYLRNTDEQKKEDLYALLSDQEKIELIRDRYYTVFVDEYVYEYPIDKTAKTLTGWEKATKEQTPLADGTTYLDKEEGVAFIDEWRNFVNRDDRRVWIALRDNSVTSNSSSLDISADLESIYFKALYLISQESIQTYYSNAAARGIGIESTNESYKTWEVKNSERTTGPEDWIWNKDDFNDNYPISQVDGLRNQYYYVLKKKEDHRNDWDWSNVLNMIGSDYAGGYMKPRKGDAGKTNYIPDHINEYMAACLARNRDLNNDGIIGANEIRWYLPTSGTYSRIVLGGVSLRSPLFNLQNYPEDYLPGGTGAGYSHYMGSDGYFLWAKEFTSVLDMYHSGSYLLPSNVRCIRNLGQHMNLTPNSSADGYQSIDLAYNVDKNAQTIQLEYYRTAALRDYEPGVIPPHSLASALAGASRQFKYAKDDCTDQNTYSTNWWDPNRYTGPANGDFAWSTFVTNGTASSREFAPWGQAIEQNTICGNYAEDPGRSDQGTWRVPNITEVAIMYMLGIIPETKYRNHSYASCTYEYFLRQGTHYPTVDFAGLKYASGIYTISATALRQGTWDSIHIRCVKDIPQ